MKKKDNEKNKIINNKQVNMKTNRKLILNIVEEFYRQLHKSQHQYLKLEADPDIITARRDIVNQGSEKLPDIIVEEIELALR